MGQKKASKRYNSVGSFFKSWGNRYVFFRRSSGFTLVELLIVIGIIGILSIATLLILDPMGQIQKSNDVKRKSDLTQIQKALETYNQDNNGKYPSSSSDYKIMFNNSAVVWGTNGFAPYISVMPKDPLSGRNYVYYSPDGLSYYLYASLEHIGDPQLCASGNPCTHVPNGASCGTNATCNFGVSSSNTSP